MRWCTRPYWCYGRRSLLVWPCEVAADQCRAAMLLLCIQLEAGIFADLVSLEHRHWMVAVLRICSVSKYALVFSKQSNLA